MCHPSDPDRPVRVGLLGYGLAGETFHAPLVAAEPGMRLAAVVTSDPGRSRSARERYPDAAVVATADELWERAGELDLAVVATPNRTHVPLALAALEAGLPVVVDKPLAAGAADAMRLVEAARARGLLLTVFQNRRWDGDFLTLRGLLEGGRLGEAYRFESRFERWRPVPKGGWRERGAPEEAGGLLYDLGSHLVDQALVLFGPVRRVYAELDRRRPGIETDDDAFVALTHASGVRSHLWMSAVAGQLGPRLRVLGSRAAYTKHGMDVQEERLRAGGSPREPGWGEDPPAHWGLLGTGDELEAVPTRPGAYPRFYEGVRRALREGAPPPVDPLDAVAALEVIEAAVASAGEGRAVELPRR
ncbi:MAG TPA: Gfo/Idh/MocA family oxidoreductase [Longimicrobiaceae bacterium]|nr:Gfo/Idh/MocA family oxidoreductase [Longimicrobiaceae bacterium]